jgi:hypothetical protein
VVQLEAECVKTERAIRGLHAEQICAWDWANKEGEPEESEQINELKSKLQELRKKKGKLANSLYGILTLCWHSLCSLLAFHAQSRSMRRKASDQWWRKWADDHCSEEVGEALGADEALEKAEAKV